MAEAKAASGSPNRIHQHASGFFSTGTLCSTLRPQLAPFLLSSAHLLLSPQVAAAAGAPPLDLHRLHDHRPARAVHTCAAPSAAALTTAARCAGPARLVRRAVVIPCGADGTIYQACPALSHACAIPAGAARQVVGGGGARRVGTADSESETGWWQGTRGNGERIFPFRRGLDSRGPDSVAESEPGSEIYMPGTSSLPSSPSLWLAQSCTFMKP